MTNNKIKRVAKAVANVNTNKSSKKMVAKSDTKRGVEGSTQKLANAKACKYE